MLANLNTIDKDNILKLLIDLIKRVAKLEAELLKLAKRIQVLESA